MRGNKKGNDEQMNILITSASAKVILVKEFAASAKKYGSSVFTADLSPCAAGFFGAGHFLVPPLKKESEFEENIFDICLKNNIKLIIPTRDEDLVYFSCVKNKFRDSGISVLVAEENAIQTCVNKRKFSAFLKANGMASIPDLDANSICDSDFPLFIRPVTGSGSRGCFLANSHKDIYDLDREKYLIHPNISSKEYSIDVLMDLAGKKVLQSVCRERVSVSAGESKISKIVKIPEIERTAENICEKLELVGHNVLQAFYIDGIVVMIEANARFGGASNISIKAGLNSIDRIVRMFFGDESAYANQEIKTNLIMYRFSEDYICEQ